MHGTIAQAVSLVSWGNYFLAGGETNNYFPQADVFSFCRKVSFSQVIDAKDNRGFALLPKASSPPHWFENLHKDGTRFIQLGWTSTQNADIYDHQAAAFTSGGGQWQLMTICDDDLQTWSSEWIFDEKNKENLPWTARWSFYKNPNIAITKNDLEAYQHHDSQTIINELKRRTQAINGFARAHNIGAPAEPFATCLNIIKNNITAKDFGYNSLIAPDVTDQASLVLANAAQACWAFGGMGTWNDLGFEDEKTQTEYEELSTQLFEILVYSYQALANINRDL